MKEGRGNGHHIICKSNLSVLVADDGEAQCTASNLIDIVDPSAMSLYGIGREPDQFHPTFGKVGLILGQSRKLSSAHRGVVLGVREEDGPAVANPLMEVDETQCRLSLEVWCCRSQAEAKRGQAASVSGTKLRREGRTYGGARGALAILTAVFGYHLFS